MQSQLGQLAVKKLSSSTSTVVAVPSAEPAGTLTLTNDKGLSANVAYDLGTQNGIQHAWISITVNGKTFAAVPKVSYAERTVNEDGSFTLAYLATDFLVGDTSGSFGYLAIDDTVVSRSGIQITIQLSASLEVTSSSLSLIPRS
jgi:hypothetical protein